MQALLFGERSVFARVSQGSEAIHVLLRSRTSVLLPMRRSTFPCEECLSRVSGLALPPKIVAGSVPARPPSAPWQKTRSAPSRKISATLEPSVKRGDFCSPEEAKGPNFQWEWEIRARQMAGGSRFRKSARRSPACLKPTLLTCVRPKPIVWQL